MDGCCTLQVCHVAPMTNVVTGTHTTRFDKRHNKLVHSFRPWCWAVMKAETRVDIGGIIVALKATARFLYQEELSIYCGGGDRAAVSLPCTQPVLRQVMNGLHAGAICCLAGPWGHTKMDLLASHCKKDHRGSKTSEGQIVD